MTEIRLKPRRRLRYEFYLLALVMVMPVALVLAFPYEAIGFTPRRVPLAAAPACAFVSLSREEAADALDESRAYWKVDTKGVRSLRLQLSEADAPEEESGSVLPFSERRRPASPSSFSYARVPLPPTLAAPPARRMPGVAGSATERAPESFAREEMLDVEQIDLKGN